MDVGQANRRLHPRILTARDDLVNAPGALRGLVEHSPGRLLELDGGGHLGYVGWSEFQELLDIAYGSRRGG